jgi:ribosomal protein L30/L7E
MLANGVRSVDHLADGEIVRVRLSSSHISQKPKTRGTLRALGLRRIDQFRDHVVDDGFRGMLRRVEPWVQITRLRDTAVHVGGVPVTAISYPVAVGRGRLYKFGQRDYIGIEPQDKFSSVYWSTQIDGEHFESVVKSAKGALDDEHIERHVGLLRFDYEDCSVVWERRNSTSEGGRSQIAVLSSSHDVVLICRLMSLTATPALTEGERVVVRAMRFVRNRQRKLEKSE